MRTLLLCVGWGSRRPHVLLTPWWAPRSHDGRLACLLLDGLDAVDLAHVVLRAKPDSADRGRVGLTIRDLEVVDLLVVDDPDNLVGSVAAVAGHRLGVARVGHLLAHDRR